VVDFVATKLNSVHIIGHRYFLSQCSERRDRWSSIKEIRFFRLHLVAVWFC